MIPYRTCGRLPMSRTTVGIGGVCGGVSGVMPYVGRGVKTRSLLCCCRAQRTGPSGTGVKQSANVAASVPATSRRFADGAGRLLPGGGVPVGEGHHAGHQRPRNPDGRLGAEQGRRGGGGQTHGARPGSRQQGVGDVPPVELVGREQVQGGQQHADPGCGRQRVERDGVPVVDGTVRERDGGQQQGRMADGACVLHRFERHRCGQCDPHPENGQQRGEAGERPGGGDVEGVAPRGRSLAHADERAEGAGLGMKSGSETSSR